jgi:hypothetical protein
MHHNIETINSLEQQLCNVAKGAHYTWETMIQNNNIVAYMHEK